MSAMGSWTIEPRDPIEELTPILENISTDHARGAVEAFLRCSTLRKVELDGRTGVTRARVGREQGGALRWVDPRDGSVGFAAASGRGVRSLNRCRRIAQTTPTSPAQRCPWNETASRIQDIDSVDAPPTEEELRTWLLESVPGELDWAWVEAGVATETWLCGGTLQERRRARVWAAWMPIDTRSAARPLIQASRNWSEFRRGGPAAAWNERLDEPNADRPWPGDAQLIFSPETSAYLALLLARVAHHPTIEPGRPVGPGWVLSSGQRQSLFGSDVDDAGFATRKRILADGRHVLGNWAGPGQLRRASFRDAPEPTPLPLQLDPPKLDPPKRAVWVTRVEIHPSGDCWAIRLHGRRYPEGAGFRPCWERVRPQNLIDACLGGVGPAHESYTGVTTPALVFDRLLLGVGGDGWPGLD